MEWKHKKSEGHWNEGKYAPLNKKLLLMCDAVNLHISPQGQFLYCHASATLSKLA